MLPVMVSRASTSPVTAVVGGDGGFGAALAAALEARSDRPVVALAAADDRAEIVTTLDRVGDVAAVVHVCADDAALVGQPIASTDAVAWHAGCERVLWRALTSLQAAHATLSPRGGGHVVMVTATAGVSGAPQAVPLLAAIEGTRSMAKSAARQWGGVGISVNCVAVPLDLLAPTHAGLTSFLPPAAIPRGDPLEDVAGAIEFLSGPGASGISGATLLVDGGAVMAP
jgi:3-oxoacyl-[acyl-carrier protein] reductase